jgi:hypothetical protein
VRLCLLLLLGIVAGLFSACGGGGAGGPLAPDPGNSSAATAPAHVGQIVAFGIWLPENQGEEAVVRSIEPADPEQAEGLELQYAGVEPNSDCKLGALYGWPPQSCRDDLLPIQGFRIRPGVEGGILVGARASEPGRWFVRGFRVQYDVGGRSFEAVYPQGIGIKVEAP